MLFKDVFGLFISILVYIYIYKYLFIKLYLYAHVLLSPISNAKGHCFSGRYPGESIEMWLCIGFSKYQADLKEGTLGDLS